MDYDKQLVTGFKFKITNVTEKNKPTGTKDAIKSGQGTLALGQKIHFDCTPIGPDGKDYPGESKEVQSWTKEDGHSPLIEYKWFAGGQELSNSDKDPFHLGSYEGDNGGCTPTLKLNEQLGPGRNAVSMFPFIQGRYNGGIGIEGQAVVFYVD